MLSSLLIMRRIGEGANARIAGERVLVYDTIAVHIEKALGVAAIGEFDVVDVPSQQCALWTADPDNLSICGYQLGYFSKGFYAFAERLRELLAERSTTPSMQIFACFD